MGSERSSGEPVVGEQEAPTLVLMGKGKRGKLRWREKPLLGGSG